MANSAEKHAGICKRLRGRRWLSPPLSFLLRDASRWSFCSAMGESAGHNMHANRPVAPERQSAGCTDGISLLPQHLLLQPPTVTLLWRLLGQRKVTVSVISQAGEGTHHHVSQPSFSPSLPPSLPLSLSLRHLLFTRTVSCQVALLPKTLYSSQSLS